MAKFLKSGLNKSERDDADAKVRAQVESILGDIEERGDAAVRDLSKKFDAWSPQDFRLSEADIEAALSKVAKRDLNDIRFAQEQVRNFATIQKDSMAEIAV